MSEEIEELTEEELARMLNPSPAVYYVYFDDNGNVDAITNEKRVESSFNVAEVSYTTAEMFLTGKANFINYKLSLSNKNTYVFVKKMEESDVGLNTLGVISEKPTDETSCIVEWNKNSKEWQLYLQGDNVSTKLTANLVFYISLINKNFLVRTIKLDTNDFANNQRVTIPFSTSIESDISKITVSTRKFFDSYGLIVNE